MWIIQFLKPGLNIVSGISGFTAAALWLKSTVVAVKPSNHSHSADWQPARLLLGETDFIATAVEQNRWSRRAAVAASIAAFAQGVAAFLP